MRFLRIVPAFCTFALFQAGVSLAAEMVVGQTYEIVERDALEEVESRAKNVDWNKLWSEGRQKINDYRPANQVSLPHAHKNASFTVDMSRQLEIDVPDGKGGILYPKGTVINPLASSKYSHILVVLDGDDPDQVSWFRDSPYSKKTNVKLLLTDGNYYKVAEKLRRQVFYVSPLIVSRFQLRAVPSVVSQAGEVMQVQEIAVPRKRTKQ